MTWGLKGRDNGKENGNYYSILWLYRIIGPLNNGKENGNWDYIGDYRD